MRYLNINRVKRDSVSASIYTKYRHFPTFQYCMAQTWICRSWHAVNQIKLYCDFMPWLIEFETYGNAMLSGVTNSQHNIMVHVWIISIEVFCAINSYRHIKAIFAFTGSRLITSTHRGRDQMATTLRVISNSCSSMNICCIWLQTHWSLFPSSKLIISHHWCRYWFDG